MSWKVHVDMVGTAGCMQARERGPVEDADCSVAAQLLRIRDPKTGQCLTDELLAGEFGMFFTAGAFRTLLRLHCVMLLHCWTHMPVMLRELTWSCHRESAALQGYALAAEAVVCTQVR